MRILRLVLECTTPLHCGGGSDAVLDQPVARDAYGAWRIPASSLAGSLRSLGQQLDSGRTPRMFGRQTASDSAPSLIWCEDGLLLDYDGAPALAKALEGKEVGLQGESFVRDHVRLKLTSGTAEDGGKYDMEFVPAGTRFLVTFRCDGWDGPLQPDDIAYFEALCAQVLAGKLTLGGKLGLGYGQYRIHQAEYRHFDLQTVEGMEQWLRWDALALPDVNASEPLPGMQHVGERSPGAEDGGLCGWVDIPLCTSGPMLIGGGSPLRPDGKVAEGDMLFALTPRVHYKDGETDAGSIEWDWTLPASSLRGVMRHAMYDILVALGAEGGEKNGAAKVLESIFGQVEDQGSGQCGKVIFTDATLKASEPMVPNVPHVALDRFSGAPVDGALFSEEPFWAADATTVLRLGMKNLAAPEAALIFHALLDLFEGSLGVGSGVNRGNGRLQLPHWRQDKATAWASLTGDLSWNGDAVLGSGLEKLQQLAAQWDAALQERAQTWK